MAGYHDAGGGGQPCSGGHQSGEHAGQAEDGQPAPGGDTEGTQ